LREFLTTCLTDEDEITNIEYTKKVNREKGPAFVCIEVPRRENFNVIQEKIKNMNIAYKIIEPNDELYNLLL